MDVAANRTPKCENAPSPGQPLDQQSRCGIDQVVLQIGALRYEAGDIYAPLMISAICEAVRSGSPTPSLPSIAASLVRISSLLRRAMTYRSVTFKERTMYAIQADTFSGYDGLRQIELASRGLQRTEYWFASPPPA